VANGIARADAGLKMLSHGGGGWNTRRMEHEGTRLYALAKTGGKQYRVEQGSSLLVERLPADEGAKVSLQALLLVDGSKVVDDGKGVTVQARVVAHERGPKLRVVKFKPKRGYKRRTGHRQDLTRLEVTSIKWPAARRAPAKKKEAAIPAPRRRRGWSARFSACAAPPSTRWRMSPTTPPRWTRPMPRPASARASPWHGRRLPRGEPRIPWR